MRKRWTPRPTLRTSALRRAALSPVLLRGSPKIADDGGHRRTSIIAIHEYFSSRKEQQVDDVDVQG